MTRKVMGSIALFLCSMILLTGVLAGCQKGSEKQNAAGTKQEQGTQTQDKTGVTPARWSPDKEIKISVFTFQYDSDIQKNYWKAMVEAYNKHQPKVKIDIVDAKWEQARTWLTMQLTAGTAPELLQSKLQWGQEDFNKNQVIAVNDLLKKKSPYVDTPTWADSFSPLIMKQLPDAKGNLTTVCHTVAAAKIYYNRDMFTKAGITTTPKDWKAFIEMQQKLLDKGIVPIAFANSKPGDNIYNWVERLLTCQLMESQLPELDVNKSGLIENNEIARAVDMGLIDLEKSPYKDVFPIIKDWSKYWSKGYNAIDNATAEQMFIRGDAAMFFGQAITMKSIDESGAKLNYGLFSLPFVNKEVSKYSSEKLYEMGGLANEGYSIPTTAKGDKLDAAVDFLMFLTSPEGQKIAAEKVYATSSLNTKISEKLDGWAINGETQKLNLYGPVTDKKFSDDSVLLGQLYLDGKVTLEKYMEELNKSLKDAVARMKTTNNWNKENNYGIK